MKEFKFLWDFIRDYGKGAFFSRVTQNDKGYYARETYDSFRGILYLPLNKNYVEKGAAIVLPKIDKYNCILSNFYNLKPYAIRALDYEDILSFCKKTFDSFVSLEILKDEIGNTVLGIHTKYDSNYYYAYTCYLTKCILLSRLNQDFIYTMVPTEYYKLYNDINDKVKDTEYETLSYHEIVKKICSSFNTMYSVYPNTNLGDDDKFYLRDDDYNFLDEETVDLINDMIDDSLIEIRFLDSSDLLYLHLLERNVKDLFNKYSIEQINTLSQVNTNISDIYSKTFIGRF